MMRNVMNPDNVTEQVIKGHPIISKTWSGIGVVSHLFTNVCPISAHEEFLMQFPGVQFSKTRTELERDIKSGRIRLATTGELLDKVDEYAVNKTLTEVTGSKVNLRELNREDALSIYKHFLTSPNVKMVRFLQQLIKTL